MTDAFIVLASKKKQVKDENKSIGNIIGWCIVLKCM